MDSNHRSRRLGFFGSGLGSARFLPLGSPFHGAGCPCGLGASRCCLALGPQLFGLIEMIEPLPSFPGRQSIAIQWGSTRPPRHGKLRGRVKVGKCFVYIVFWSGLGHGLNGPPLFIDGKLRRRRPTEDFPPPLFSLRHATRCFSARPLGLDLNRASPWFYSSMRRGYARGVTRHKQPGKTRYD
jgi:hypothetical protein